MAHDGGKVARDEDGFVAFGAGTGVGEEAAFAVVEVKPFKAVPGEVVFVEGGLAGVEVVEIAYPVL